MSVRDKIIQRSKKLSTLLKAGYKDMYYCPDEECWLVFESYPVCDVYIHFNIRSDMAMLSASNVEDLCESMVEYIESKYNIKYASTSIIYAHNVNMFAKFLDKNKGILHRLSKSQHDSCLKEEQLARDISMM